MHVGVHFWVGDLVQRAFELGFEIKLLGLVADSERKTYISRLLSATKPNCSISKHTLD